MQSGSAVGRCFFFFDLGPLLRTTFTVEHVGTGYFVVAAAHQAQFDLVLYVLNVEGAATRA
jgi:hypothetical protein